MIEAFVLVRVTPVRLEQASNVVQTVKAEIAKLECVKDVKGVFGRYDLVVIVEPETSQKLGTLVTNTIRNVKGVAETETLVVGF